MGDFEFRGGQHVSVYIARAWGDVIVAPLPKPRGLAVSGLVEVQALATTQTAGCPRWVKNGSRGLAAGCLLCPQERTSSGCLGMSEKCRYCCKSLFGVANENS